MALTVYAFACFVLVFTLLILLVYLLCPEDFMLKASLTKWMTIEVKLKSPQSVRNLNGTSRRGTRERRRQP
jgi:hypothetical protein